MGSEGKMVLDILPVLTKRDVSTINNKKTT